MLRLNCNILVEDVIKTRWQTCMRNVRVRLTTSPCNFALHFAKLAMWASSPSNRTRYVQRINASIVYFQCALRTCILASYYCYARTHLMICVRVEDRMSRRSIYITQRKQMTNRNTSRMFANCVASLSRIYITNWIFKLMRDQKSVKCYWEHWKNTKIGKKKCNFKQFSAENFRKVWCRWVEMEFSYIFM